MLNAGDILETITMIQDEHLDVRTITMGISLLDCCDSDIDRACRRVYDKITRCARDLVKTGEDIEKMYGIPIINKRISVTPIAMIAAACENKDMVRFARTLEKAAVECGVNFIGGYSALVQKGFAAGDRELIESIPEALAVTDHVCSSVNIGSTKAGINMDAVALMGQAVRAAAERTADRDCIGCAKLVVFCNAPEDNPFMAGAFHGAGEPDCVINVGVSGPGVVRAALAKAGDCDLTAVADLIKKTAFKITRMGQLVATEASHRLGVPFGIVDLSLAPTPAVGDSVAHILEEMGLERCGAHGTTAALALLNDAVKKGVYPGDGGCRDDSCRPGRLPAHRKAGSHDRCMLSGPGYDQHSRRHAGGGNFGHHCGRGGYRHGQLQNNGGAGGARHRQAGGRRAVLRWVAGRRTCDAAEYLVSRPLYRTRRTDPCAAAKPEKLTILTAAGVNPRR